MTPFGTLVIAGSMLVSTPNNGEGEHDLFAAATAADGSTWAAGWYIDAAGDHRTLAEQSTNGAWSIVPSPNPGTADNGFAGIAAIPGGGLWAVGITGNRNPTTLIEFHR